MKHLSVSTHYKSIRDVQHSCSTGFQPVRPGTPGLAQRQAIAQAKVRAKPVANAIAYSTSRRSVRVHTRHGLETRATVARPQNYGLTESNVTIPAVLRY